MSSRVDNIKAPIKENLEEFQRYFRDAMKSKVSLLDTIMRYIHKRKGKQMRPMFVLLCAKLTGEINESSYRGASLIELLHTATLVHDDVVDDSNYRRGFFSVNALWKNKIAVLVGDYLLSKGLLLALKNDEFKMLKEVSNAVEAMSEGELLQIEKARRLDIKEEIYYDIISKKTASLIATSCAVGALSVTEDSDTIDRIREFGQKVGMAFQIKDDLFDYGTDDIGKPLGIDIKEKKMTLPLIHALENSSWLEKKKIIRIIKSDNQKKSDVKHVIQYVKEKGGLDYAHSIMLKYKAEAITLLHSFEQSASRDALEELVNYTIDRKK